MKKVFSSYVERLNAAMSQADQAAIEKLAAAVHTAWEEDRQVFLCGNGGSAGNAAHIANDLLYGINKEFGRGLKVQALSANASIVTCLANDEGYDEIFSKQLAVYAEKDDILIALSGSGNSPNILKALKTGNAKGMKTFAVLGYSGGKAKSIAQTPIHFAVDDMQISEDLQMIVCHAMAQYLYQNVPAIHRKESA